MYIIQTNESLNNNMEAVDFQSLSYCSKFETFDEFKNNILNSIGDEIEQIRYGTMNGRVKPMNSEIVDVAINDDFHLEIVFKRIEDDNRVIFTRTKYYKVKTEEKFNIDYNTKYKITYMTPQAAINRTRLDCCTLFEMDGFIENFSPCNNVVINTEKGLQILNYRQIVEMVTEEYYIK